MFISPQAGTEDLPLKNPNIKVKIITFNCNYGIFKKDS